MSDLDKELDEILELIEDSTYFWRTKQAIKKLMIEARIDELINSEKKGQVDLAYFSNRMQELKEEPQE